MNALIRALQAACPCGSDHTPRTTQPRCATCGHDHAQRLHGQPCLDCACTQPQSGQRA